MKAGRQFLGLPAFCCPPHGSQKTHSTHFPTLSPNRSFFLQSRYGFVYITSLHRVVGACAHTQIHLHTADVQGDLLERQGNLELNYLGWCSTGPFTEGLTKVKSPAVPEDETFYLWNGTAPSRVLRTNQTRCRRKKDIVLGHPGLQSLKRLWISTLVVISGSWDRTPCRRLSLSFCLSTALACIHMGRQV